MDVRGLCLHGTLGGAMKVKFMRTFCTLVALFASVATAAEPAPNDPVRRGAAVATPASLSASPSRASLSGDTADVPQGGFTSSSDSVAVSHGISAVRSQSDA